MRGEEVVKEKAADVVSVASALRLRRELRLPRGVRRRGARQEGRTGSESTAVEKTPVQ